MIENKMSFFSGSLLWFGAAISIAEIFTGALIAPLGFELGITAILLGHMIGCILFYFAGLIGAKSKMTAMESVGITFGRSGSLFFSVLNILQLVGWTAVMILSGANALGTVVNDKLSLSGNLVWCLLLGGFNIVWIIAGIKNVGKINNVAVVGLFLLTVILGITVFKSNEVTMSTEIMSFGLALELSIAMPVSWLPLISDYTKNTDRPVGFTLISTVSYFLGSSFMYIIGLGAAVYAGNSDIVQILMKAGFGLVAMLIIVLSTVTTTFLDVYSASESVNNIYKKWNAKWIGIFVCVLGTIVAAFTPIQQYENFLYLIGSVFIPMAVIHITDYFLLHNVKANKTQNLLNIFLWVIGFIIYRVFLGIETFLGSTIPVVIIVMSLCIIINMIKKVVMNNVSTDHRKCE